MTSVTRARLVALWYGAALASLFFYPLLQALGSDIYYLLWQRRDTAEFALAFVLLMVVFAAAWYALGRLTSARLALAGTLVLALIPVTSCAVAIMRLLPVKETLIPLMATTEVRLAVVAAAGLSAAGFVGAMPLLALKLLRGALAVISPVVFIAIVAFVRLAGSAGTPTAFNPPAAAAGSTAGPSIFVFLFDELSYRFVYRDGAVTADLPNLRRLSERSTNYLAAFTPGNETITSVPGLLAGRALFDADIAGDRILEVRSDGSRVPLDLRRPDGLFGLARARGLRTEIVGYFLPYCRLLEGVADSCRSFSWYNYSTVADGFSPLNPVLTNLILWPYQAPFGVLKVPPFAALQRRIVEQSMAAALAGVSPMQGRFRFVHFSVPHLPFVFNRGGFSPSRDPMRHDEENYRRNLAYVDTMVGELLAGLEKAGVLESSTVVIMSDHEYRWPKLVASDIFHIPLIVKHPAQHSPDVVTDSVGAEQVLRRLVRGE